MKKDKFNQYSLIGLILIIGFMSCSKMDFYYKDYMKERDYIGKVDTAWFSPGDQRIKFYWTSPSDPSANKIIFFWNDYLDSVTTSLEEIKDTGSIIIDNLPEGSYTFYIITADSKGNRSVPVEVNTTIYGETMKNNIENLNRSIDHAVLLRDSVIIFWKPTAEESMLGTNIEYVDKEGSTQNIFVPVSESESVLHDVDIEKKAVIASLFTPDTNAVALDSFYSKDWDVDLTEQQLHTMSLTGVGTTSGDYIDLFLAKVYPRGEEPDPSSQAANIDIVHQRGSSSKHNLFTADSPKFSSFSSSLENYLESWEVRNEGLLINIGNGIEAQELYNHLDENNRTDMKSAFESALAENQPANRITKIATGDIILYHSIDRDMYVAIKAIHSVDDGGLDIEFKISRF